MLISYLHREPNIALLRTHNTAPLLELQCGPFNVGKHYSRSQERYYNVFPTLHQGTRHAKLQGCGNSTAREQGQNSVALCGGESACVLRNRMRWKNVV